jgi:hypothetical protein
MKDNCADCGWEKTITRTFMKGRNEVRLCAECEKAREHKAMPGGPGPGVVKRRAGLTRDQMLLLALGILLGVAIGFNLAWYLWSLAL